MPQRIKINVYIDLDGTADRFTSVRANTAGKVHQAVHELLVENFGAQNPETTFAGYVTNEVEEI